MYKREKFCIEPPNQNQILWRFMNRNKFQGIMGQKKLFFANIKSFEDHTENKYTEGTHKNYVKPLSSYGNKNFCIAQNLSETKAIKDLNDFTDNKGNCIFASWCISWVFHY